MPKRAAAKRALEAIREAAEIEESIDTGVPPSKRARTNKGSNSNSNNTISAKGGNRFNLEVIHHESIVVVKPKNNADHIRSKIAAFDMDSTLVEPKSGKKFPASREDWQWMFESRTPGVVPNKLKDLYQNQGYRIVIISNQNGIAKGYQKEEHITGKIIDLSDQLEIPLTAILATDEDHWRKPSTRMWKYFLEHCNPMDEEKKEKEKDKDKNDDKGDGINHKLSVYVGDAAGREKSWNGNKNTRKDFSCGDRKFAKNCGLTFYTPEVYFLGDPDTDKWGWEGLDPEPFLVEIESKFGKLCGDIDSKEIEKWYHGSLPIARPDKLEMIIMHGPPAAGKSTFAKKFLESKGYVWVNRDTAKTQAKCQQAAESALQSKKSVVIDNTNPDPASRDPYIKIAKKYKADLRAFIMTVPQELAEHMNLYREKLTQGSVERIGKIAYRTYYKKVREGGEPTLDEGFSEVVRIDFVPRFENELDKKLFLEHN